MSGDRWVVRYPGGQWGVERSSRRTSHQLFGCMEDALAAARAEAAGAGGGDVVVQAADGQLSLREQVMVERPQRRPQPRSAPQQVVAWTVFA